MNARALRLASTGERRLRAASVTSVWNGRHAGSPEQWASRWCTLMPAFPYTPKLGMKRVTRSSTRSLPSRTSSMTPVVVASGLVSDERSNTVSRSMGGRWGSRLRDPNAACWSTSPRWATSRTAPGNTPAATASLMMAATRSNAPRVGLGSVIDGSDDGRLQRHQPPAVDVELDLDPEGQREILHAGVRRIVAGRKAEADRIRRSCERGADHVDRAHPVKDATRCNGPEHAPRDPLELARLRELGEQAIEPIGPLVHVLEEEDGIVEIRRPRRAEGRGENREGSAEQ